MNIQVEIRVHYSQEYMYVVDPDIARAIRQLTHKVTVSDSDVDALVKLGHSINITHALGRRLA